MLNPRLEVLYCDLACGFAEHSGIYIGNNQIVELNGGGDIAIVSPKEFIDGGTGVNHWLYFSNNRQTYNLQILHKITSFEN